MTISPSSPTTAEWPDVSEDDPDVIVAAHAIAEHGIGRPWDDFLPTNAYDIDHGDLIEYGRAAVAALRAQSSAVNVQRDSDIGILLSALRMHEEAVGESFDDDGGNVAQIEADYRDRVGQ